MVQHKFKRIDLALSNIIDDLQEKKHNQLGIDISFREASRLLANDYIEMKMNKKPNKKERDLFRL